MPFTLPALLHRHARLFEERRLAEMLGAFAFPCPIHLEDRLVVMPTPEALEAGLSAYRRLFAFRGIAAIHPVLEGIEAPDRQRVRAWVRWAHEGPAGIEPLGSRAALYLRHQEADGGGYRRSLIEMVHYTHLSVSDIKAYQPRAA